ncbi:MAG: T9SS type A sorting domain-containing protein [Crocinitomicaceae bacterium]
MRACILFIVSLLFSFNSFSQVPDSVYHERLYHVCKAWGYMKYFHTEIADGNVNWDDELLDALSGIKNAPDNAAFNDSLLVMLNSAGVMGTGSGFLPVFPDSLNNDSDQSWIQDPIFSSSVGALLDTVTSRFRPQPNVFVGEAWAGGNPTFDTDDQYYSGPGYPTEEKRVLALFRYWNCIHYFFPYKYIMDQDWDVTLKEFIPEIVEANSSESYMLAFKKLTTRIDDSHSYFNSPAYTVWNGTNFPPFRARYIEDKMVITQVLSQITSVSVGDIILEIDGHNITDLRDSLRVYAHGSNDVIIEREINSLILRGTPGSFMITVDNGSSIQSASLNRNSSYNSQLNFALNGPSWSDTIVNGSCHYGIVDMGLLESNEVASMFSDLSNTDAIIFDIRNYPNGTLWDIVNYLYPFSINIANFTTPDITYPGRFSWHYEFIGSGAANLYLGDIIILFDERTQSQAEYTCMGLEQFPGAIKIGSTTSAADGNVALMYMPGNIVAYATFLGTYYPDFTPTQRVGIIPDYEVLPTIQGIRNGEDEVLNFALNCALLETEEIDPDPYVELYPNPTSDIVKFSFEDEIPSILEIVDMRGGLIERIEIHSLSGEVDLSALNEGMYMFRFHMEERVVNKLVSKI